MVTSINQKASMLGNDDRVFQGTIDAGEYPHLDRLGQMCVLSGQVRL